MPIGGIWRRSARVTPPCLAAQSVNRAHGNSGRQPSRRANSANPRCGGAVSRLGGVDTYRIHKMMAARVTTAR